MNKSSTITLIDTVLVFVWGIFFLLLPFIMTTAMTDAFTLPKVVVFSVIVLLSLLLWAAKMVLSEKVAFRRTPFDVPVLIFLFALILSSLFSLNRADSLLATIPVVLAGLGYFIITNSIKKEHTILYVLSALLVGGAGLAVLALFSYFRVYPLLFQFTHVQSFTPLGSLTEQAFYFVFLLPISVVLALPILKGTTNNKTVTFAVVSTLLTAGLLVTLLQLFTTQRPVLLPFETGFQTAFAAISQDTGRVAQGFLFGSGYGNFSTVFTRFKQASFNTTPFWATQFTSSSSFLLELLATTGVLGMLSFLFLLFRALTPVVKKKTNPVYLGLVAFALISLVLPFSYIEVILLFVLLGLFAGVQGLKDTKAFYDVELKFVALKKGMISLQQITVPSHEKHEYNKSTAMVVAAVLVIIVALVGWFGIAFASSDMTFQTSLVLTAGNNGTAAYKDQAQAITTFPYQSAYYRVFSQTNIALAGSLATLQHGSSPSAQTQNTLYALIQQGITTAKTATTISPLTVADWQNLSSVYRSLIGVGQNADSFAILAAQQATQLDPTNPQEFVAIGGIYYQIGQWDNAIREFQQAITLKPDYPNAYYNLGHAYESKGDYADALTAYQSVAQLVSSDPTNSAKVQADIAALQKKMGSPSASSGQVVKPVTKPVQPVTTSEPLQVNGVNPQPPTTGSNGLQTEPTTTVAPPAPAQ